MTERCPSCGAGDLAPFYRVDAIPVQSNLLAPTRDEAVNLDRADLALAHCPTCGFMANTAFDPASQEHSAKYEATQGCSGTFNTFAKSLARQWAHDYLGPGKLALEVGCLRGEFMELLHEVSGCNTIGFDPVLESSSPTDAPVRLVADYYSPTYADIPADLIVCRHTLEHIPDVGSIVRTIRSAIGDRLDTAVAIEVPDTLRVLREGAFWDVYIEHCSYFTPGSLARLFRSSGFDLIDLRLEYDDQYIILEAKPAGSSTTSPLRDIEDDLAAIQEAVDGFPAAAERQMTRWRKVIDETLADGKRVALWGSGSKAVGFLSTMGIAHDRVELVVDINPRKQGTYLAGTGQRIVSPEALVEAWPDLVIVMNPVYVPEIRSDLQNMGLSPQVLAL